MNNDGISMQKKIENYLSKINNNFNKDYRINNIKSYVFGMSKKEFRLTKNILNKDVYHNSQAYDICRDTVNFLCNKYNLMDNKIEDIKNTEYFIFKFMNKAYDDIDINKILNRNKKKSYKNINIKRSFKYYITLGRLIFNYKDNCVEDGVDDCNCENYTNSVAMDHQHIIIGDMKILQLIGI